MKTYLLVQKVIESEVRDLCQVFRDHNDHNLSSINFRHVNQLEASDYLTNGYSL